MNLLPPYKATIRLRLFIDRVNRLQANNYSNKRFRTYDLSVIEYEIDNIQMLCSVAIHNKNDVSEVINLAIEKRAIAKEIVKLNR